MYDFGDDWRHDIFIESVGDGEADVEYPAFVDGERRSPPEDVGGVTGFMEFLEAVRLLWSGSRQRSGQRAALHSRQTRGSYRPGSDPPAP